MTTGISPEGLRESLAGIKRFFPEYDRKLAEFPVCLYYNVHINEDQEAAFAESKKFLDLYYAVDWPREFLELWVAHGSPQECLEKLRSFAAAGATEITIRFPSWDQKKQIERFLREVAPHL